MKTLKELVDAGLVEEPKGLGIVVSGRTRVWLKGWGVSDWTDERDEDGDPVKPGPRAVVFRDLDDVICDVVQYRMGTCPVHGVPFDYEESLYPVERSADDYDANFHRKQDALASLSPTIQRACPHCVNEREPIQKLTSAELLGAVFARLDVLIAKLKEEP